MRIVIYGQVAPSGPIVPLRSVEAPSAVQLNRQVAQELRDLADVFDPPGRPTPEQVAPEFEAIARRLREEGMGDGTAAG